ncbi:MAG: DNA mismatch repair protein MutS [Bacillota bacterium]|nr:DNA mismatch repair protein MutS [Bacillota bacterium]
MAEFTPMMKQYLDIKDLYKDCILFYRLGDFYEMFFEDAELASRELDLVLTGKDCGQEERAPMCGVPYHSCEGYIARLIQKGYKVAICEQVEDPKTAKGLVKREVIRMITPGTVIESSMLDDKKNNFICSVFLDESAAGICFIDLSTGECYATGIKGGDLPQKVINELGRFVPSEAVLSKNASESPVISGFLKDRLSCMTSPAADGLFEYDKAAELLKIQFLSKDLDALGVNDPPHTARAVGALLSYLNDTQKTSLIHINTLDVYMQGQFMELDVTARRNLELCETLWTNEKKGSLLWVLDKTETSMGSRLLRSFLEKPLIDVAQIKRRQQAALELNSDTVGRLELKGLLKNISDLERLIGRVVYGSANCRDLKALSRTASVLPRIKAEIVKYKSPLMRNIQDCIDELADLRELIDRAITDDPPFSVREGGMIKAGYNNEVDRLSDLLSGGRGSLAAIEASEREKTGIRNLKVGYNKVFGYYIEISNSYLNLVPETYIRKQTLTGGERFITQELKELESTVLTAKERITALEYELFCEIRDKTAGEVHRVQRTAHALALLDVLLSFAEIGAKGGYTMPDVDYSDKIHIKDGRHPVVETMLRDVLFVPNDTALDGDENRVAIITGPNMAGKSTFMRQTALIVIMAQTGCFVPAKSAEIGVCDRVFTRIGASDDLSSGKSTFMVEMNEVAEILKNATPKSLLILDEIGRGTSTFDGMAIARAVLEYVSDKRKLGAKTMFATHYHELTELEDLLPGIKNYNVAVKKRGDDIIFLRRIVRGGADDSYGIEVAKLAGIPDAVIARAKKILSDLDAGKEVSSSRYARRIPDGGGEDQITMGSMKNDEIISCLKAMDVDTFTPIEALNKLFELHRKAGEL